MADVEIGVVKNNVRRFAAQLERDLLQIAGGGLHDELADFGRAGERNFVDIRMGGQRGAGRLAVTSHDVDDAIGKPASMNQFAEPQGGQWRLLGRLENDGAAGGQRGTEFPRGHQQREIPRNDLTDDADGLAQGVGKELAPGESDVRSEWCCLRSWWPSRPCSGTDRSASGTSAMRAIFKVCHYRAIRAAQILRDAAR